MFLAIWLASMVSNLGSLIQSVGAGWLMTSLAPSADMVALVQSSTSLPILILALLSGALADMYDRRLVMLAAQTLMLCASLLLVVVAYFGLITPWSLLGLTFLLGCGTALHAPSWQASVGDQVPREDLPGAVALNSLGFNIARTVGPALGGLIIAITGPLATFMVNAVTYVGLIAVLALWRPQRAPRGLPRERLGPAMAAGLRYARMAPVTRTVLSRAAAFGLAGSAVWALMPLIARDLLQSGPATYGLLLGAFGGGAVVGALTSTSLRNRLSIETLVSGTSLVFGLAIITVAVSRSLPLTLAGLFVCGGGWVLTISSLNVSIQMAVPRWVVGRLLSLFQMSTFGGMAVGSWCWGHLAEATSLSGSLTASGIALCAIALLRFRWPLPNIDDQDLSPLRASTDPEVQFPLDSHLGRVIVMIEYRVRHEHVAGFMAAMRDKRRIRVRDGAQHWSLLQDLSDHEIWVERFQTASWAEHLRQRRRVTLADRDIEERVKAFHCGAAPLRVRRLLQRPIGASVPDNPAWRKPKAIMGDDPSAPSGA